MKRMLRCRPALLQETQHRLHGQDSHATLLVFEGELNRELFQKALEMAFEAHPNLRTGKIAYDGSAHFAEGEKQFADIICEFHQGGDPRAFLREKLSAPFVQEGGYWQVYCFSEEGKRHHLIQCFDHSIADGISTAALHDEILTYYADLLQGKEVRPMDDQIADVQAARSWDEHKQLEDQLAAQYPPASQRFPYEVFCPLEERTTEAVLLAFPVQSLYERSKKEGRTVNEVVVAASLLALRDVKELEPLETNMCTCVSYRQPKKEWPFTERNLDDLLGVVTHPQTVTQDDTIETVADRYKELLQAHWELGNPFDRFSSVEMRERYEVDASQTRDFFPVGLSTSNLGKIVLRKRYGPIRVAVYQFFANQIAGFCEMLADWLTVEDTVFSNFTYVEPLHSREWALRFTQLWISHLKEYGVTPLEEGTDPDLLERLHG